MGYCDDFEGIDGEYGVTYCARVRITGTEGNISYQNYKGVISKYELEGDIVTSTASLPPLVYLSPGVAAIAGEIDKSLFSIYAQSGEEKQLLNSITLYEQTPPFGVNIGGIEQPQSASLVEKKIHIRALCERKRTDYPN